MSWILSTSRQMAARFSSMAVLGRPSACTSSEWLRSKGGNAFLSSFPVVDTIGMLYKYRKTWKKMEEPYYSSPSLGHNTDIARPQTRARVMASRVQMKRIHKAWFLDVHSRQCVNEEAKLIKNKKTICWRYNTFDWSLLIYCWGYLVQRNQWIHARPHTLSTSLLPTGKPHTTALISTHPHTSRAHPLPRTPLTSGGTRSRRVSCKKATVF